MRRPTSEEQALAAHLRRWLGEDAPAQPLLEQIENGEPMDEVLLHEMHRAAGEITALLTEQGETGLRLKLH
jgi:hypothetical protein